MKRLVLILFLCLSFFTNAQVNFEDAQIYVGTLTGDTGQQGANVTSFVVDNVTETTARGVVSLDAGANGNLEFYADSDPNTVYSTAFESSFLTSHIQTIGGSNPFPLTPNTAYTVRFVGTDENTNPVTSDFVQFTTLSTSVNASVAATDGSATEAGTTTGQFTVTLSSPSSGTTTVNYSVSGTATPTSDYTALTGSVDITDTNTSATITVTPVDDGDVEGTETVIVQITSGTGYSIGAPNTATVSITDDDSGGTGGNPNWFPANPSGTAPSIVTTYTPTSAADVENAANADKIAIISNSFDCTNCTFASGQIIRPAGGAISGSNIGLNGAYIEENTGLQAFADTASFSEQYDDSYVEPELFGAGADDAADDWQAIQALLENVVFVRSPLNAMYIRNNAQYVDIVKNFIWDMNGGRLEVTSNSTYYAQSTPPFILMLMNVNLKIFNGTLDMNDLYGRGIWTNGQAYHLEDFTIENQYSNVNYRAEAFKHYIYQNTPTNASYGLIPTITVQNDFVNGYINNCNFRDIVAESDCAFNNVPAGVSKGVHLIYEDLNSTDVATIYHSNNTYERIYGDDAEALYLADGTFGGVGQSVDVNNITTTLFNETYREISRRAIKATVSNLTIEDCRFEMVLASTANAALASMVDIFKLAGTAGNNIDDWCYNVVLNNNEFINTEDPPSSDPNCPSSIPAVALLSLTSVSNAQITNNTFTRHGKDDYAAVRLGASGNIAGGKFENVVFDGNTYNNAGFRFINFVDTYGDNAIIFRNEIFNFALTGTGGTQSAAYRFWQTSSAQIVDQVDWENIDITVTDTDANFFGVLYGRGVTLQNCDFSDVDITYTVSQSATAFGTWQGNMDNSNTIDGANITGEPGTNALVINGTEGPVITNSTGDSSSTLTVQ